MDQTVTFRLFLVNQGYNPNSNMVLDVITFRTKDCICHLLITLGHACKSPQSTWFGIPAIGIEPNISGGLVRCDRNYFESPKQKFTHFRK